MEHLKGKYLVIRADAGGEKGTGHLMRCLALAQAWQDAGGRVIFITGSQSEGLLQRLQKEGFDIHQLAYIYPHNDDWDNTKSVLADHPDAWVVLDGYHFDEIYQQRIKDTGHQLLVIDDMAHLKHYYADIVLNQNLHAEPSLYSVEPYTHLLLGTRYALLNREFLAWKDWKRNVPEVAQRVLVTLGGSDPSNNTLKVIQALQGVAVPSLEANVVVGASNTHAATLEAAISQSRPPIRLICDARNMPELMAWADVAVSAGGITIWELAFMGLPGLVMVTADNQLSIAKSVDKAGVAAELGWHADVTSGDVRKALAQLLGSKKVRASMSRQGRLLVDGEGSQRVIFAMVNGC